jgi:hypothetical protein
MVGGGVMTKAELRAEYIEERDKFMSGAEYTNQYALYLDTMLSKYFNLPLMSPPDDGDVPDERPV